MPPILNAQSITKQFGATPLFKDISFTVEDGGRIGLIGPNGAGKSTLLAILAGAMEPDAGELAVRKRARAAYVPQDSRFAEGLTVRQVLEAALAAAHVSEVEREGRLRELAGRAGFEDLGSEAAALSGGWRKRLAIVEALVSQPDVLLLDEPTNHLDLAGIEWLEELLTASPFAVVTVSHDRYFLEATSSDIIELNPIYSEGLLRVKGSFSRFLEERQAYLEAQSKQQESLRNRVRTEIEWLRRGPKARTTKSKARIDAANEMIGQLAAMDARSTVNTAGIDFGATQRKTKRLVEFSELACEVGGRRLFGGLNFTLTAGTKLGLVGPNGSGKTSLLRLMRGELEPIEGNIRRADSLRMVYLSQMRELDEDLTLRRALAPEGDGLVYQGRAIHVASWAARFLFTGEQLNQPVRNLSGGERARVLIAKLMLQPADVLMLDEPTNDLDIPTLEILEDNLLEFEGALVLVTHDRYLLNRVATTVIGLDGNGQIGQFADFAQWEDWIEQGERGVEGSRAKGVAGGENLGTEGRGARNAGSAVTPGEVAENAGKKKKLSYLEAREFAGIEERVEGSDARLAAARARVEDPAIATDAAALQSALADLADAERENENLYARWAELTDKAV